MTIVVHKGFPYLENWLGLKEVVALEPKPGVEPTSAHLAEVLAQLQRQPAKMVIRAAYAAGLALSALFDLPSGAVIVWTLAAMGLLVNAWRSFKGQAVV